MDSRRLGINVVFVKCFFLFGSISLQQSAKLATCLLSIREI